MSLFRCILATTLRVHPAETRLTVYRRPYIVYKGNCPTNGGRLIKMSVQMRNSTSPEFLPNYWAPAVNRQPGFRRGRLVELPW